MDRMLTAKELAKYFKLSESTIYKLTLEGELPGFKIGDSWRFDMTEILRLIKNSKKSARRGNHSKNNNNSNRSHDRKG